jgi:hypothetical protein
MPRRANSAQTPAEFFWVLAWNQLLDIVVNPLPHGNRGSQQGPSLAGEFSGCGSDYQALAVFLSAGFLPSAFLKVFDPKHPHRS